MCVVQADQRRQHQADGQQQLEHGRTAPASFGAEHFGQQQRRVARGQRHDRDRRGEQQAGQQHRAAAADQVGDHAGEQRGQHAAQQHRRHDEAELLAAELPRVAGGGFEIGQGAGDDADIDAVQQAAEAADEEQEAFRCGLLS
ncbi:hypothetical protein G6F22_019521 [Rhizopus arrhizus]|nr:hypothetical protein G6F22_019521 [Rhizopus arrhizus]